MAKLSQLLAEATANGNGALDGDPHARLSKLLGLPAVGLHVTGARIIGRGRSATADLYLSDGTSLYFESLKALASPKDLAVEVAACTGAQPKLNSTSTIAVVSLVKTIAKHQEVADEDAESIDWATEFLQRAAPIECDWNDQADRWRVFALLASLHPLDRAQLERTPIAAACLVPVHRDGTTYVRRGWFRDHVRSIDGAVSAQQVANRMQRVGWLSRGSRGRIHARRPNGPEQLVFTFFIVPPNWLADLFASAEEAW